MVRCQTRSSADDLLELHDRADWTKQDDVSAGRDVNACREELGGRGDHRRVLLGIDEVAEMLTAHIAFIRNDPHHVMGVLASKSLLIKGFMPPPAVAGLRPIAVAAAGLPGSGRASWS